MTSVKNKTKSYFTDHGREFRLLTTRLQVGYHTFPGAPFETRYWTTWTQMNRIFTGKSRLVDYHDGLLYGIAPCEFGEAPELTIGCQPFSGKNYLALKRWALAKPRKRRS